MSAMREHFVKQKVALGNLQRGCLLELGIPIAKSDNKLIDAVESLLEDANLNVPMAFRASLKIMNEQFKSVMKEIRELEMLIEEEIKNDDVCERPQKLEGVGPVGSMMLKVYFSCIEHFKNGREASACAGLTPVQHSSGGKEKLAQFQKNQQTKSYVARYIKVH
ncbi:transposase [Pseudoalteromonas rhizosphaerae]|uniref:Transposase n=1 Tax=Pseudoalteromonas rhizosphaerae TaxID=2518973 RepID=A0ABW8KXP1_9GAMM